ncbi:ABC transporter substrate-binding protein [Solwaraspora sp. WMMA2080]|uniref:ABC transporter substrate-binding protein n=1 Tax=unclassified Solwaraspora TaxID=2627926 RepID=UPI00248BCE03|nr:MULTISPECIES: ABC transporter substrate-binding protein [unclassified Solwaraspora]WBB99153.1 ABC transporter substrate-binding protein [Solwaraspora sp. WMMA2059]WBC22294.1 ABC transporter substrate-binding protein [Solwaraspora sp. WMMA2080]
MRRTPKFSRRSTTRRLIAAACATTLLVSAAGCGGDDGSADDGDGSTTVRLGFSAWPGWFPWQVAEEQGLFEENGVDVELTYFDSYTDSLTALATGNLDANSQTLNDTLSSVSGGAAQTVVLVNDNSTGNDQIIAAPGIDSVADLAGKRIAIEEGTVDHYLLLLALAEAGLSADDVEISPLLTDAAAAAFLAGQVDAVGAFAPFTTTALGREGSTAIVTSADFPGAIPDHLVFDSEFVADHPEQVQAVVDTWFDTLDWIADNPDEAVEIMAAQAGVSVEDYRTYDAGTTIFDLADNQAAFEPGDTPANLDFQARSIAEFLVETGLVDEAPPLDGLLDGQFVGAVSP